MFSKVICVATEKAIVLINKSANLLTSSLHTQAVACTTIILFVVTNNSMCYFVVFSYFILFYFISFYASTVLCCLKLRYYITT